MDIARRMRSLRVDSVMSKASENKSLIPNMKHFYEDGVMEFSMPSKENC